MNLRVAGQHCALKKGKVARFSPPYNSGTKTRVDTTRSITTENTTERTMSRITTERTMSSITTDNTTGNTTRSITTERTMSSITTEHSTENITRSVITKLVGSTKIKNERGCIQSNSVGEISFFFLKTSLSSKLHFQIHKNIDHFNFCTELQKPFFHHKKPQTDSSKRPAEDSYEIPQCTEFQPSSESLSAVFLQHKASTTVQIP